MELILDTDFVIALERERRKSEIGPAKRFLEKHSQDRFFITFTVAGELACGRSAAAKQQWQRLCRPFPIVSWTPEISWIYGDLYRHLQEKGTLIGANDLWIAATALSKKQPLVSNNIHDFKRVPGLQVEGF